MFTTPEFVAAYSDAARILTSPDVQFDTVGCGLLVQNASLAATKMTPYEYFALDPTVIALYREAATAANEFAPASTDELQQQPNEEAIHYTYRAQIDQPLQKLHTATVVGWFVAQPERVQEARVATRLAATAFSALMESDHHVVSLIDYEPDFATIAAAATRRARILTREE